jgi:hypothetical protein
MLRVQNIRITGFTDIGVDLSGHPRNVPGVFNRGNNAFVNHVFVTSLDAGSTGFAFGLEGNICQTTVQACGARHDGAPGGAGVVLAYADHISFYQSTFWAETGLRIVPQPHPTFPVNIRLFSSPIHGVSTKVTDMSPQGIFAAKQDFIRQGFNKDLEIMGALGDWTPIGNRGVMLWPYETADSQPSLPDHPAIWGVTDSGQRFGTGS